MGTQTTNTSGRTGGLKELLHNGQLSWRLFTDPKVSVLAKLVPVAALLYLIMPLDLLPDIIPGIGQLDDIAIILVGIRAFLALCPPELVQWYRRELGHDFQPQSQQSDTIDGTYRVVDD